MLGECYGQLAQSGAGLVVVRFKTASESFDLGEHVVIGSRTERRLRRGHAPVPTNAHTILPLPDRGISQPQRAARASTNMRPRPDSSSKLAWAGSGSLKFSSQTSTSAAIPSVERRRWMQARPCSLRFSQRLSADLL